MSGRSIFLQACAGAVCMAAVVLCACAGSGRKGLSPSPSADSLTAEADSLFTYGNFPEAKALYEKIYSENPPESAEARNAHFRIAYIDVFYKNPFADWNFALTEFKSFAALYQDDPRSDEVRSWIRVLTTIKSFETEYRRMSQKAEQLMTDNNAIRDTLRFRLDSMAAVLRNAYAARDSLLRAGDSLARKNTGLINTIIDLEKKCQQAGK